MPHASDSPRSRIEDPFGATDEVKVYKDEGEDEKPENLSEEKFGLVTETEEGKATNDNIGSLPADDDSCAPGSSAVKLSEYLLADHFPFGYPLLPPYAYPNGSSAKIFPSHPGFGLYMYGAAAAAAAAAGGADSNISSSTDTTYPPPAHMGIQPLYVDSKTAGLARQALYRLTPSPGHLPHSLYPPSELSHIQCFDLLSRGSPFHGSAGVYPPPPPAPLSSRSALAWFSPPPPPPHTGLLSCGPAAMMTRTCTAVDSAAAAVRHTPSSPARSPADTCTRRGSSYHGAGEVAGRSTMTMTSMRSSRHHHHSVCGLESPERRREYVKKPLNAFMLFMKEKRQRVIEECTLKESAAINQILGRKWHALGRAEQAKYYEMARKEKELHMQLHPGWSARDNYATHTKKKKKTKRDVIPHQQQQQQLLPRAVAVLPQLKIKDDPDRSLCTENSCVNLSHGSANSRHRPYRASGVHDGAADKATSNGLSHDSSKPVITGEQFSSPGSPSTY